MRSVGAFTNDFEERHAFGGLDAVEPHDVAAAGVELAVLREHADPIDLFGDDPEEHDHPVGPFELDGPGLPPPGCGCVAIDVPSTDGSSRHVPQQAEPSE